MMDNTPDFPETRVCPVCNKKFEPAIFHSYKITQKTRYLLVCSYSCLRRWEREKVDKRKKNGKKQ